MKEGKDKYKPKVKNIKSEVTATRLTDGYLYSKNFNYAIVLCLTFVDDETSLLNEQGQIIVFKQEAGIEDYTGRDLDGVEIYDNPKDFEKVWEITHKHSFTENYNIKGLKISKIQKTLTDLIGEMDKEIK